ncbi:MAG: hypothetical protein JXR36_09170 [Bacteroidales bacterium]|nr:hypothetical protein [Bacteroidales bacterium]
MKIRYISFLITIFAVFLAISCNNNEAGKTTENETETNQSVIEYTGEKLVITDKIMYDVQIVNDVIGDRSKNSPDWFWENLPTPESDDFIKSLLTDALSGKLKTYYYDMTGDYESFDEILPADLQSYMDEIMTYEFEVIDTTVKRYKPEKVEIQLTHKHVKKLRFLEEWFLADGVFHKRIIAVAPYFTIEYPGLEPINAVYFWVMINKDLK